MYQLYQLSIKTIKITISALYINSFLLILHCLGRTQITSYFVHRLIIPTQEAHCMSSAYHSFLVSINFLSTIVNISYMKLRVTFMKFLEKTLQGSRMYPTSIANGYT